MEDLNILACADLHGSEQALELLSRIAVPEDYDLVLVCGDFTTHGSPRYVKTMLRKVKVKVLGVPGNCDTQDIADLLEKLHASVHNRKVSFGGWEIFGFGGGTPTSAKMPFEVEESIIEDSLRTHASSQSVMVTHTPPFGMNDQGRSGVHAGSKAIRRIAEEFRPRLALSGHMHESKGKQIYGDTVFVNPGSLRNGDCASIWLGSEVKVRFHEDPEFTGIPEMY